MTATIFSRVTEFLTARLAPVQAASPRVLYDLLQEYYDCNDLYGELARQEYAMALWQPGMKPVRNPTFRVVEFYACHLWPGTLPTALPIITPNADIVPYIQQVWKWSNWAARKQVAARQFAMLGDMFIKVAQNAVPFMNQDGQQTTGSTRVYMQVIHPASVTDFDVDERDNITYARLDIPQSRRDGDELVAYCHTEIWDAPGGMLRVYEHQGGAESSMETMGTPRVISLADMGIDFVPLVHAKFRDVGADRGCAAVLQGLAKIDELNLQATRLHQMLFKHNDVTHAITANGLDADGRPLPPPMLDGAGVSSDGDGEILEIGGDKFISLPGNSRLEQLVPNLQYDAALAVVTAMERELEKDLPELTYYRLPEMGQLSGVAVKRIMGGAIKRALEARGNAEAALIKAQQMALTIGQMAGLFPSGLGSFDAGNFEHEFAPRDVLPIDETELMAAIKSGRDSGLAMETILARLGWAQDEIKQALAAIQKEKADQTAGLAQALLAQRRQFDQGGTANGQV